MLGAFTSLDFPHCQLVTARSQSYPSAGSRGLDPQTCPGTLGHQWQDFTEDCWGWESPRMALRGMPPWNERKKTKLHLRTLLPLRFGGAKIGDPGFCLAPTASPHAAVRMNFSLLCHNRTVCFLENTLSDDAGETGLEREKAVPQVTQAGFPTGVGTPERFLLPLAASLCGLPDGLSCGSTFLSPRVQR